MERRPHLDLQRTAAADQYYTNLTLGYNWNDVKFFLAVQNLFDRQPTPWGNVGGSSAVPGLFGGYIPGKDLIGRYYTAGFRLRM